MTSASPCLSVPTTPPDPFPNASCARFSKGHHRSNVNEGEEGFLLLHNFLIGFQRLPWVQLARWVGSSHTCTRTRYPGFVNRRSAHTLDLFFLLVQDETRSLPFVAVAIDEQVLETRCHGMGEERTRIMACCCSLHAFVANSIDEAQLISLPDPCLCKRA